MRRFLPPRRFLFDPASARTAGWRTGRAYHGDTKPNVQDHYLPDEIREKEIENGRVYHGRTKPNVQDQYLSDEIEERGLQGNFQRGKAFTAMFDPNGHYAFHIVTPREAKKDRPRPLRDDELFQMPDVVLDLDAYDAKNVREADGEDEVAMADAWGLTQHQRRVRSRVEDLRRAVAEARATQQAVLSSSTNPWRVTSHDVLSAALRGLEPPGDAVTDTEISQEFGPLRVSVLTYATPDQGPQMRRYQTSSRQQQPGEHRAPPSSDRIDPRQSPDFLENVRANNGIPLHATQNNELLLRWIMSRRNILQYDLIKADKPRPAAVQIASDLQAQSCLSGIRRVVFHSIGLKADLNSYSLNAEEQDGAPNIAREIRDACVRVMDASSDPQVYRDTIEFLNNLGHRLPYLNTNMEACAVALWLRCLARLGKLELVASRLRGELPPEVLTSELDILPDVGASLRAWDVVLSEDVTIGSTPRRRLLLELLTGCGRDETAVATPYRSLIFSCGSPASPVYREERTRAYEQYILLLGRLGAIRTIWREWKTYTSELRSGTPVVPDTRDPDAAEQAPNVFSHALSMAISTVDEGYFTLAGNEDPDLSKCQKLDHEWIGRGTTATSTGTEQQAHHASPPEPLDAHELLHLMALPLNDSLAAMEKRRRALHTE